MTVQDRLKLVRETHGKTQKAMALALGISPRTWQDYEGGVNVPGWKVLEGLAGFGFNVNWLLTGDGEMKKPVRLSESEAHQALKKRLVDLINSPSTVMGYGLSFEMYRAYLYGDYLPTEEELAKLCNLAGGWTFNTGTMSTRSEEAEAEINKQIEELTKLQKASRRIDIELLKAVTTEIEEALFKSAIKLDPVKKAELLALVYDYAADSEGIKEQVQRLLRLVR